MTPEQETELLRLWDTGMKATAIGRVMGMAPRTVSNKIYALGLARRVNGYPESPRQANIEYGKRLAGRRFT